MKTIDPMNNDDSLTSSKLVLMILCLVMGITGCTSTSGGLNWTSLKQEIRTEFPEVKQISVNEIKTWLESEKQKPILIDARSLEEYKVSHLNRALFWGDFKDSWEPQHKTEPIVVYCSVGYRSSAVADRLQDLGFSRVYNLEGSIFEWVNSGNPVFLEDIEVQVVHPYDFRWGQLLKKQFWSREY